MSELLSNWSQLELRRKIMAGAAALAVFATVLGLSRFATAPNLTLLYAGLEPRTAGEIVSVLDSQNIPYDVRGGAIYVDKQARDKLRMSLASQGLPGAGPKGYELLDELSGFGTTSQMFNAKYWRAKEGELARTIMASSEFETARVHIASSEGEVFSRQKKRKASVTVTPVGQAVTDKQARALRFLVASAVTDMTPNEVSVIDTTNGLVVAGDASDDSRPSKREEHMRAAAERILEARVGEGNAIVELSLEIVTEQERITERRFDPEQRVPVSTETEERSRKSSSVGEGQVTVASNLPEGDAAGGSGDRSNESAESRELVNYEIGETQREVVRSPGAIKRLSVAVLVNDLRSVGDNGEVSWAVRSPEEIDALRDLVVSALGVSEARGDTISIQSMRLANFADSSLGTSAVGHSAADIDLMRLIQLGVLSIVALVLGLFVIRPILTVQPQRISNEPQPDEPLASLEAPDVSTTDFSAPILPELDTSSTALDGGLPIADFSLEEGFTGSSIDVLDPAERLRGLIEERHEEAVGILQNWMEEPEEA